MSITSKPSGESSEPEEKSQQKPRTESPAEDQRPVEIGGRKGPEPTRFGDWEKDGRCIDF